MLHPTGGLLSPATLVGICFLLGSLPFLLGLVACKPRREQGFDSMASDPTREIRPFGLAFRSRLQPALAAVLASKTSGRHRLGNQDVMLHRQVDVSPRENRLHGILVSLGDALFQAKARIGQTYVTGAARIEEQVEVGVLACDGDVHMDDGCRVERWLDAHGQVRVGANCDLGVSASSAKSLEVGEGCRFRRLWGLPIAVKSNVPTAPEVMPGSLENSVMRNGERLSFPAHFVLESDLVVESDVMIGAESVVRGLIRVHGNVYLQEGARVEGPIYSRKSVFIGPRCVVTSHVFAEGDVTVGADAQVGDIAARGGVFAARRLSLANGARIFGWARAGLGGATL